VTTFTDSHCHLAMVDRGAADAAVQRARDGGVKAFLVPATKLDDAQPAIEVARRHRNVWAAVGFHPHEAVDFDAAAEEQTRRLAADEKVVAIGEIGLDYFYDHSPRDVQREVFLRQIAIARELDLPVIIHNRDSTSDLLELLQRDEVRGVRGVLHSFTESLPVALQLIDLGFFISFSGIVTFRTAEALRDVARAIPLERMLIETDTPFLTPVPFRGKENEPAYVVKIAEMIASLRGVELGEVAEATTKNFQEIFQVKIVS
jgi:TatD DNase family protein